MFRLGTHEGTLGTMATKLSALLDLLEALKAAGVDEGVRIASSHTSGDAACKLARNPAATRQTSTTATEIALSQPSTPDRG